MINSEKQVKRARQDLDKLTKIVRQRINKLRQVFRKEINGLLRKTFEEEKIQLLEKYEGGLI